MKKTKPTNYEAAKRTRREIPTKRSLSAKMKKDRDFIVVSNHRGPTVFQRIA